MPVNTASACSQPAKEPWPSPGIDRAAAVFAGCVLGMAGLGLAGGLTGWLALSRFVADAVPMAVSTALLFLCVGGALALFPARNRSARGQAARAALALMVVAVGLVNVFEYVFEFDARADIVDYVAFRLQSALVVEHTPMSPVTGALFVLTGVALLLTWSGRGHGPRAGLERNAGGLLGLLVAVGGFTISLAYLYGQPLFYESGVVPVAVSTGLAFLAAGLGLVCDAGPQSLPLCSLLGDSIRARLLRAFPPLVALCSLSHPFFNHVLHLSSSNSGLVNSVWATLFASTAALVAVHMGRTIGTSMDKVEAIRRSAEQSLRESEERYRVLINTLPNGIVEIDASGTIDFANLAYEAIYGFEPGEMVGMSIFDLTVDEAGRQELHALLDSLAKDHPAPGSCRFKRHRKDGREITVQVDWNYRCCRYPGMEGYIASITDITDRSRAENDLRENEELLRNILQGIRAGIVVVDPTTYTVTDMNPVAEGILGMAREDVVGKSCRHIRWRNSNTGEYLDSCPIKTDSFINEEFRVERPDGRIVPIIKTVIPARRGNRMLNFEVIFDFTERKALERQLVVAQRLESIGQLASGIAHEINTPIQYVGDNLSFLETAVTAVTQAMQRTRVASEGAKATAEEAELDFFLEEIPKALAQSLEGVGRVASIVSAMKRFSHPGGDEKSLLDVNKAIENTVTVSRNEWKYHADIELDLSPDAQSLLCFAGDFNQVMLNMLVNAAHAVSEKFKDSGKKGLIRIQTRRDGQSLAVTIADNGVGIQEKNLNRIYDPFFTTKEVGKGTGQGLAIVHDIVVNKHGGTVAVASKLGEGTTFELRFPFVQMKEAFP